MAKAWKGQTTVTSGELSPMLGARVDLAAYQYGAAELQNMLPTAFGAIINRPGLESLANYSFLEGARMVKFVVGINDAYILALHQYGIGESYYDSVVVINATTGSAITTYRNVLPPYTRDELQNVKTLQNLDVMYLFHPNHQPFKITRTSTTTFMFGYVEFKNGPYTSPNPYMSYQGAKEPTSRKSVPYQVASSFPTSRTSDGEALVSILTVGNKLVEQMDSPSELVGKRLKIVSYVKSHSEDISIYADDQMTPWRFSIGDKQVIYYVTPTQDWPDTTSDHGSSTPQNSAKPLGNVTIQSKGVWFGFVDIYEGRYDIDTGAYELGEKVREYRSLKGDFNFAFQTEITPDDFGLVYLIQCGWDKESHNEVLEKNDTSYIFEFTATFTGGVIEEEALVTRYNGGSINAHSYQAERAEGHYFQIGFTNEWYISAFGGTNGYPSVGGIFQNRLVLAATPERPQSFWMSAAADWENFETHVETLDTDSISGTLASREINAITGFSTREDLIVFTTGGTWIINGGWDSRVVTPSSITAVPVNYVGSSHLQPLEVEGATIFVTRQGNQVKAINYSGEREGYTTQDLSIMASHLFEGGRHIISWDYQALPWGVVWCVLDNGLVLGLTILQEHNVLAWSRHIFNLHGEDGAENGRAKAVVALPSVDQDEVFFVCQLDVFTYLYDRFYHLRHRVDAPGEWRQSDYQDEVYVNSAAPYVCRYRTMEFDLDAGGPMQGRPKSLTRATARVRRSLGFNYTVVNENQGATYDVNNEITSFNMDPVTFPDSDSPGAKQSPWSGDIDLALPGGFAKRAQICIEQDTRYVAMRGPLTILGLFIEVAMNEDQQ